MQAYKKNHFVSEPSKKVEIAVDIGGTFTDIVCVIGGDTLFSTKVPTTSQDLVLAVEKGVAEILELAVESPANVHRFIHGTTVATNAILEQKGASIGILMTEGFEDTLEIGRQKRPDLYDLFLDPQTPTFLAPRRRRFGITERVDSEGSVVCPLDEKQVEDALERLVKENDIEAVAVCYLFSFLNPVHELRTREIIRSRYPSIKVSLSCEIDPTFREYERVCVTAFDAYLRPVMETYVGELSRRLRKMGISARLQLMQSRGGITSGEMAIEKPVSMLLSGPSGGVIGGKVSGELSGFKNLITMDIGGTSCDIALIQEGKPLISTNSKISGFPLRISMIDVNTIGSGGGSIAWLDNAKTLHVGPQSAGAFPGPACYGLGGREATVTDASVLLGYINPSYFAGGKFDLDVKAAEKAVGNLAEQLGIEIVEAAYGIHKIVNAKMADETRLVSVHRGYDPRRFALVLLGGAGAVHGGLIASDLSIPIAIVPETPGVLSAYGLLVAPVEQDNARTFICSDRELDVERFSTIYNELEEAGEIEIKKNGLSLELVRVLRSIDMRYRGQSFELEVPVLGEVKESCLRQAVEDFHKIHQRVYGHSSPEDEIEFVTFRAVHVYDLPIPELRSRYSSQSSSLKEKGKRSAYFAEEGFVATPFYDRNEIPGGSIIEGPAIIEQVDTTTVIYPGHTARLDEAGNIILRTMRDSHA